LNSNQEEADTSMIPVSKRLRIFMMHPVELHEILVIELLDTDVGGIRPMGC
jgi:hypothetical protein